MSSHGGRRSGSGRKKIFNSKATKLQTWQKTHKRVWLDGTIYSSWVSIVIVGMQGKPLSIATSFQIFS